MIDQYFSLQAEFLDSVCRRYEAHGSKEKCYLHALSGSLKFLDALHVSEHIRLTRPQRILEVGSFLGFSTRWILEASREIGSEVVSIDPGLRHRIFDEPRAHALDFCRPVLNRLTPINAFLSSKSDSGFLHDYAEYEPRSQADEVRRRIAEVPLLDKPFSVFDLALIDGDHSHVAVAQNISLVSRMMPNGGLILVHDAIAYGDVAASVREITDSDAQLRLSGIDGTEVHCATHLVWRCCDAKAGPAARLLRRARGWFRRSAEFRYPDAIRTPLTDGLAVVRCSPALPPALVSQRVV